MLQLMDQILKGDFDLKSYCQNRSYDGMTIGKKCNINRYVFLYDEYPNIPIKNVQLYFDKVTNVWSLF